jgi:hypothetical protein
LDRIFISKLGFSKRDIRVLFICTNQPAPQRRVPQFLVHYLPMLDYRMVNSLRHLIPRIDSNHLVRLPPFAAMRQYSFLTLLTESHYTSVFSASPSTPSTPQPSMSQAPPTASTAAAAIPYPLPPDLLNRVNAEAKNNPALQDALNLAADGKANQEQLLLLGKFIQNLPPTQQGTNTPTTHANKSSSYSTQHPSASTPTPAYTSSPATYDPNHPYKRADIIFEFRENTVDRWILPLDNILIEKIYRRSTAVVFDILISTFAPFDTLNNTVLTPQIASRMKNTTLHPLTFRLTAVSPVLWDAIGRRAKLGDLELVSQTQAVFKELVRTISILERTSSLNCEPAA